MSSALPPSRPDQKVPAKFGKREQTRKQLIETALGLIIEKGIAKTSVLEITAEAGVSNGSFYYHFENLERLLEVVGKEVIERLIERIQETQQSNALERIAFATLLVFEQADRHPQQRAIMFRVMEDHERRFRELGRQMQADIEWGAADGDFHVHDPELAMEFSRSILSAALRRRYEGDGNADLPENTAVQTLMMLGIAPARATEVVRRMRASFAD